MQLAIPDHLYSSIMCYKLSSGNVVNAVHNREHRLLGGCTLLRPPMTTIPNLVKVCTAPCMHVFDCITVVLERLTDYEARLELTQ